VLNIKKGTETSALLRMNSTLLSTTSMIETIIIQSLIIYITTTITITAQYRFNTGIHYVKKKYSISNDYTLEKNARIVLLTTYLYSSMLTETQAGEQPSSCVHDFLKSASARKTGTSLALAHISH
jgi:hypothetical protein